MKYSIVYDKPQRIRFRCGAYAFDKAYEGCIYNFLIEKNYVKKVEVNTFLPTITAAAPATTHHNFSFFKKFFITVPPKIYDNYIILICHNLSIL
jgi:hypothetical protein